jgi:hypothetical protein
MKLIADMGGVDVELQIDETNDGTFETSVFKSWAELEAL